MRATNKSDLLNIFNIVFKEDSKTIFTNILDIHQSHTTNSLYILALDDKGAVYQLSFSDHNSGDHHIDLDFHLNLYFRDEVEAVKVQLTNALSGYMDFIDNDDNEDWLQFYGVTKATKYDPKTPAELIGKPNADKARVSDHYTMTDAELTHDNQILAVTYDDGSQELYCNYTPDNSTLKDAVLANWLYSHSIDRHDARCYSCDDLEDPDFLDFNDSDDIDAIKDDAFDIIGGRFVIMHENF